MPALLLPASCDHKRKWKQHRSNGVAISGKINIDSQNQIIDTAFNYVNINGEYIWDFQLSRTDMFDYKNLYSISMNDESKFVQL